MSIIRKLVFLLVLLQISIVSSGTLKFPELKDIKPTNWEKSSWDRFQIEHLLNPNEAINAGYKSWNSKTWTRWLRKREFDHQVATHFKGPLLSKKNVNIVIVGTPEEIEDAFQNFQQNPSNGLFWSNKPFESYVFLNRNNPKQVLECKKLYFTTTLESGHPAIISNLSIRPDFVINTFICGVLP